jgi:hypothetical protein
MIIIFSNLLSRLLSLDAGMEYQSYKTKIDIVLKPGALHPATFVPVTDMVPQTIAKVVLLLQISFQLWCYS